MEKLMPVVMKMIARKLEEAERALEVLEEIGDYRVNVWGKHYRPGDVAYALKSLRTEVELDAKLEAKKAGIKL